MLYYTESLCHYGLKGMKWGTRRWQFNDGRFNDAGKARYFGQNSTHRPDSVRVLQGDKPANKTQQAAKSAESHGQKNEFDKEKAKKIAKGVAIGAAVVGGTVLAVYGAKKINDLGGVSTISKNVAFKMRETRIESLKTAQEYKVNMASIKAEGKAKLTEIGESKRTEIAKIRDEGKANRAKIGEEAKTNLIKLRETARTEREKIVSDAKMDRQMNALDPEGRIDRAALKRELVKRNAANASMRMKGAEGGLEGRRLAENYVRLTGQNLRNEIANLTPAEVKRFNSGEASLFDLRRERAAAVGSSGVSNDMKIRDIASNISSKTRSAVNAVKKTQLPKITVEHVKAGANFLSELNKTAQTAQKVKQEQAQRDAAIVKMYKAQHPNTKLSDKKILKNYRDMTSE